MYMCALNPSLGTKDHHLSLLLLFTSSKFLLSFCSPQVVSESTQHQQDIM